MKTMTSYINYCTEEQTRRAYELGAPIMVFGYGDLGDSKADILSLNKQVELLQTENGDIIVCQTPTTQQMIGWLREILHLVSWVIDYYTTGITRSYGFTLINDEDKCISRSGGFYTDKQAELAAIDAALTLLEESGNNK